MQRDASSRHTELLLDTKCSSSTSRRETKVLLFMSCWRLYCRPTEAGLEPLSTTAVTLILSALTRHAPSAVSNSLAAGSGLESLKLGPGKIFCCCCCCGDDEDKGTEIEPALLEAQMIQAEGGNEPYFFEAQGWKLL